VVGSGISAGARSDTLLFPPDSIAVDSLTRASLGALDPDRGPIDPGLRHADLLVLGIAALVAALLAVGLVVGWGRRRRRAAIAAASPAEPPGVRFARALDALRREGSRLSRDHYHDRLSEAIRRYVTEAAGIDAVDRTTRELEGELRRAPHVRAEAAAEIVRILKRSDLVKFARRPDAWEEARALLEDAAKLEDALAPPPPRAERVE
jgi:hypothetical protein